MKSQEIIKIGGHELTITNRDKVYFPKDKPGRSGITKGEIIDYYRSVAKVILPYLKGRPESLNRHPNGISGPSFFQKDVDHQGPAWAKTAGIHSESNNKTIRYLVCDDEATLVYMANLGCIELNPWHSRTGSLTEPDYCLIDLDPQVKSFDTVIQVAQVVHEVLEKIGAKSFVKTTGKRGMHILIPLDGQYSYDQSRQFAQLVVTLVHQRLPKITSLERSPAKRRGKVYLDYLQNSKGQTMAAAYCVRPAPGATVSTPLDWDEVKPGLDPKKFTIKNTLNRLDEKGDLLKGLLGRGVNLEKLIAKLKP